jgi:hypothetical protein
MTTETSKTKQQRKKQSTTSENRGKDTNRITGKKKREGKRSIHY